MKIDPRNRSICLQRIYDKWCFDLNSLSLQENSYVSKVLNKLHFQDSDLVDKVIEHVLLGKNSIRIIPESNRSDIAECNRIKLRSLYRKVTQIERETGLQETYLGFPFLVGHINDNELTYVRGPVVLFPVSIEFKRETRPGWYIVPSQEKPPTLNRALLTAIKRNSGIGISDFFMEEFEGLIDKIRNLKNDVESNFIHELSNLLLQNEFPLEMPSNTPTHKTQTLKPITDYDDGDQRQSLHLEKYKIIGNFPQGDSVIYFDYNELLVGVDDDNKICGIEGEFEAFEVKKNWDGWLQYLTNLIVNHFGTSMMTYIKSKPVAMDGGHLVALIEVTKSPKAVYVTYKDNKGQVKTDFYIRALNTTRSLNITEVTDYINDHWKF